LPRLRQLLDEAGAPSIVLIAGGVIPQEDIPELIRQGVTRVFLSGTSIAEIAGAIKHLVAERTVVQ
ncbi:MAG: cobalamin B12-binding domain-containing protein, partial [Parvibaculaceae bacterium]